MQENTGIQVKRREVTSIQVKNARVYWYMRHYKDLKHLNRNFRLAYTKEHILFQK